MPASCGGSHRVGVQFLGAGQGRIRRVGAWRRHNLHPLPTRIQAKADQPYARALLLMGGASAPGEKMARSHRLDEFSERRSGGAAPAAAEDIEPAAATQASSSRKRESSLKRTQIGVGGGFVDGRGGPGFRRKRGEFIQDLGSVRDQDGAGADEFVAAFRSGAVDPAGDGKDMLPVVSGQVGGDEGAGAGGTLDHQQSLTPSSHDAVALRKGVGVGPGVDGKFRDDRAMAVRDSFRQGHVLGRIELAQSGTKDRDGSTFGGESTAQFMAITTLVALVMTGVEIVCGILLVLGRAVRPVALTIMGAITFLALVLGETPLFHANLYGCMAMFALAGRTCAIPASPAREFGFRRVGA